MRDQKQIEKQNSLITENIAFSKKLAAQLFHRHCDCGIELDDFEGAAMLGLVDAARRFDSNKGKQFRTYAYYRVRGSMYDLLRRSNGINRGNFRRLMKNRAQDENQKPANAVNTEKFMTPEKDLPYAFARSVGELASLLESIDAVEVNVHVCLNGSIELSKKADLSPEEASSINSTRAYLRKIIKRLPPAQQQVVNLRYFSEKNFEEIRQTLGGYSKSWVSRTHGQAMDNLSQIMRQESEKCLGSSNRVQETSV